MKNKELRIIVGGVLIFLFIVLVAVISYKIFANESSKMNKKVPSTLQISLEDNDIDSGSTNGDGNSAGTGSNSSDEFSTGDLAPMSDAVGKRIKPYKFKIANTGKSSNTYKVVFKQIKEKGEENLKANQLRYELTLNSKSLSLKSLNNIEKGVLDTRTIEPGKTNSYELRVWLSNKVKTGSWEDKAFSYSIEVVPISEADLK